MNKGTRQLGSCEVGEIVNKGVQQVVNIEIRAPREVFKMAFRSVYTLAKITLFFLNIWVLAVVMVVSLGQWRVFDNNQFKVNYDNSHLIVRRELKEDGAAAQNNVIANTSIISSIQAKEPQPPPVIKQAVVNKPPSLTSNVRNWCNQHHPHHQRPDTIAVTKLFNVMVDKKHKLLFCGVPGAVMNDWRKILLITNGIVNTTKVSSIDGGSVFGKYGKSVKRLADFSSKERGDMLSKYHKVMFVRDPLERLVSMFEGKFVPSWSKYFHRAFGTNIIKKYRKNAKPKEIQSGSSVKFDEFARYVIDVEHEGLLSLNEHWQQYYKLCHPCLINYDFIGTYENAEKDTEIVLNKIGAKNLVAKPFITESKRLSEKELTARYKTMSPRDLNNLFKIYSPDYTLFGYQCPHFLHHLMEKNTEFHDY